MNRVIRRAISVIQLLCFLCFFPAFAYAEEPVSVQDRKGTAPAQACWVDRESYADGSAYENPPTGVRFVRIGLRYGNTAVEEAEFENLSGNGFRIGSYDAERNFVEKSRCTDALLRISWAAHPENGLMILGGEDEEILYLSRGEDCVAIEALDGETAYRGNSYRGGFECRKQPEYRLSVINCVGLEDYVKGVVPYEMANDWPMEALKAQAVCARTYVVFNQNAYVEEGFDLTDNTESQVYRGTVWANERTDAAVNDTAGELIRWRGEVCQIYYFAADGGATEDGKNVFDADLPYLRGKTDPFEQAVDYAYKSWTRSWDGDDISERLAGKGYTLDTVMELTPEYSEMGNVIAITFTDIRRAHIRLEGRACYTVLGLYDCRFTIRKDPNGFVFEGSGLGHSCGMSQWGARAMDETYGFDYQDILRFYYTGVYIV